MDIKYSLSDVCEYRKGKVNLKDLNLNTYISTENMLPNKQGIIKATALPNIAQTRMFKKGDTLVSNIRLYFKKIWQAKYDGGCSNDVSIFVLSKQKRIARILQSIDNKIELNNRINDNLEQQAQVYFDKTFIVNPDPSWKVGYLSDIGTIVAGGTPSKAKTEYYSEDGIPWITPKDLSNNKSKFIYRGETDISELGFSKSSATKMPRGTVLFSSRAPIGYIAIAANEVTTNQGFKSVIPNDDTGTAFTYFMLKYLLPTIENMASGSTFKEISGAGMKNVPLVIPDSNTIKKFNNFCEPIFEQQAILEKENIRLFSLRDTLLPKLMSGELDVSDIEI